MGSAIVVIGHLGDPAPVGEDLLDTADAGWFALIRGLGVGCLRIACRLIPDGFEEQAIVAAQAQQRLAGSGLVKPFDGEAATVPLLAATQIAASHPLRGLGLAHRVGAVVAVGQPAVGTRLKGVTAAVAPGEGEAGLAVAAQDKAFDGVVVLGPHRQRRQTQGAPASFVVDDALAAEREAGGVGAGPAGAEQTPVLALGAGAVGAGPGEGGLAFDREVGLLQDLLASAVVDRMGRFGNAEAARRLVHRADVAGLVLLLALLALDLEAVAPAGLA